MTKAQMHTAVWDGREHTLSQSGWMRLSGRSRTFLVAMMDEAAEKGIDRNKRMQYAIEQNPREAKRAGYTRKHEPKTPERFRANQEVRTHEQHRELFNRFLYR